MVSNEVFVGANAQVGIAPEVDMFLNAMVRTSDTVLTLHSSASDVYLLVEGLYVGCTIKLTADGSTASPTYYTITANTTTTITVDSTIVPSSGAIDGTILSFGAPCYGPKNGTTGTILSDNWVGLLNTFTPPNVEVEMKQLNLAAAGGRNFDFQYKGAETVSGGSLELSLNNGSWLYYALGKITSLSEDGADTAVAGTNAKNVMAYNTSNKNIVRSIGNNLYPEFADGADEAAENTVNILPTGTKFTYTFGEADDDVLPSFALDVAYRKGGHSSTTTLDALTPHENMYSRIFTGCQVNSLTLNFEEGQELTSSVELVTRRAFDAPNGYLPLRGKNTLAATTNTSATEAGLINFSATDADNYPFLFSDGSITLFGQTVARVKSGSITISNNLTPQRFIGNYNRQIVSAHLPAQRTYEISLTMLITDTKLWEELRKDAESTGSLKVEFTKSGGEKISLEFADYLINSVTIPFPEDKGAVEAEVTAQARTLTAASYVGKWAIPTLGGTATGN